jgi:hypothetical protein
MKSLWKWCTVVVVAVTVLGVLVGTPGGKAQDSGWTTQEIAAGQDATGKRLIAPDLDVVGDTVIVGYINQANQQAVVQVVGGKQAIVDEGTSFSAIRLRDIPREGGGWINCFVYVKLGDAGPEVWARCGESAGAEADFQFYTDPQRLSGEGNIAGQHSLQGDWSGNVDIAKDSANKVFYAVWAENYDTLKVAKTIDYKTWTPCGDLPDQSGSDVRFPTIYVDAKGRVYAGATQASGGPDVQVWVSYDGCTSWKGRFNVTSNSGFSDAAEFAVIGDTFYSSNDDTTTNPNNVDLNFAVCTVTESEGLANCQGTRAVVKDAAWARLKTDGKNLHLVGNNQGSTGYVDYCFSSDGGATWKGEAIPNSKPNNPGFRDPDFGIIVARNNIAVGGDGKVYVVWNTRVEGKSKIMLSTRSAPPAKEASATCAP